MSVSMLLQKGDTANALFTVPAVEARFEVSQSAPPPPPRTSSTRCGGARTDWQLSALTACGVRCVSCRSLTSLRRDSSNTQYLEDEAQGRGVGGEYDKARARFPDEIVSGREVTSRGRVECLIKIKEE